jgi:anthranilate synthase/phosphoribosyltransferase
MVFVLDNYDSFTYNLVQYLGEMGEDLVVRRNDKTSLQEIEDLAPSHIVISPGPKTPKEAGLSVDIIKHFGAKIPILGVCLGHQCIGYAFGGEIVRAERLMHGKTSVIYHDGKGVFRNLPATFEATRYHSLLIDRATMPECLEISAETDRGEIMGVRHREYPIEGVQFHPESILTSVGKKLLRNFLPNPPEEVGMTDAIRKVAGGADLTQEEAHQAMTLIMSGAATPSQIAALTVGMGMKGETVEEIAGFARAMREKSVRIHPKVEGLVDTCGTGGDAIKTFNISTTAMFVVAGAGVPVAKHGNRAMTSKCGSADVLEALGIRIALAPERVAECIEEVGIGFMFAPLHHPAMRYAGPTRREIGVRTAFNILGPLTNPAGAPNQLIGVFRPELTELVAEVLKVLGSLRAYVVHGAPGIDEISTLGETRVSELHNGHVQTYTITPDQFGITPVSAEDLSGGTAIENARILRAILAGEDRGPRRDIVVLNAGCAIAAGGRAEDIAEGMKLAAESIDSGAAKAKIEALAKRTSEL